jgi:hypothetical protein
LWLSQPQSPFRSLPLLLLLPSDCLLPLVQLLVPLLLVVHLARV